MEISHKKGVYYLLFDCCFVNYCTVNALSSFQHANKPPVNGFKFLVSPPFCNTSRYPFLINRKTSK